MDPEAKKSLFYLGGGLLIILFVILAFVRVWVNAYSNCTDDRCPGSHAVLTKSMMDLPVCTCAAP